MKNVTQFNAMEGWERSHSFLLLHSNNNNSYSSAGSKALINGCNNVGPNKYPMRGSHQFPYCVKSKGNGRL